MQQHVYQTKVTDVNDLKQRLIEVWVGLGKTSLTRVRTIPNKAPNTQ